MEFGEKLQTLRKNRGLTQEELAESLYVSRTAVSKWETGRGYPSIDSLKQISAFFSVSIDDLLSGEVLICLAREENRTRLRQLCGRLMGVVDLLHILPAVLPLYPKTVAGFVCSVNLWQYTETASYNRLLYWILYGLLVLCGGGRLLKPDHPVISSVSLAFSVITVLYLVLAREAYAAALVFLLLMIKLLLTVHTLKIP